MKYAKLFLIVTVLVVLSSCAAYADGAKIGMLSLAKVTAEDFTKTIAANKSRLVLWELRDDNPNAPDEYRFYDNFNAMLLALEAGEISGLFLTRPVAEYLLAQNSTLKVSGICGIAAQLGYSFGFLNNEKGQALRAKFDEALSVIKNTGRLDELRAKYLVNPGTKDPEIVSFAAFSGKETVKVAVTGDLPPLDYMTADGKAAGFNTAILAEIGKYLGVNIEVVQADTAARVPALTSGRVDVVFWFSVFLSPNSRKYDITSDVVVSAPYYTNDGMIFVVGKK